MGIALLCAGGMARGADSVVIRDVAVFVGTRMLSRTSVAIYAGRIQAVVGGSCGAAGCANRRRYCGKIAPPRLIDAHAREPPPTSIPH